MFVTGSAQGPGGMPFMHNMNFLRMAPHGMQGSAYGAGRYPYPHGMGGSPFAHMGGPLGMPGGGMGMGGGCMGMSGSYGRGGDLGYPGFGQGMSGVSMGSGMGMGMGNVGGVPPGWWEMMMGLEDEEDEDEAFWDEEGEMPDHFTSYLKNNRGRRKSQGFGGKSFSRSSLSP